MNFLVVKDNKVINIIVCESKELAEEITQLECIPQTDLPHVGHLWVKIDNEWSEHAPIEETNEIFETSVEAN